MVRRTSWSSRCHPSILLERGWNWKKPARHHDLALSPRWGSLTVGDTMLPSLKHGSNLKNGSLNGSNAGLPPTLTLLRHLLQHSIHNCLLKAGPTILADHQRAHSQLWLEHVAWWKTLTAGDTMLPLSECCGVALLLHPSISAFAGACLKPTKSQLEMGGNAAHLRSQNTYIGCSRGNLSIFIFQVRFSRCNKETNCIIVAALMLRRCVCCSCRIPAFVLLLDGDFATKNLRCDLCMKLQGLRSRFSKMFALHVNKFIFHWMKLCKLTSSGHGIELITDFWIEVAWVWKNRLDIMT